MARWTDPQWQGLVDGSACPICTEGAPTNVIAELGGCWLTMGSDDAPALPGTCALFVRRHVVELHDLTRDEADAFTAAVQCVSRLLAQFSGAVKINYEVHGNTIPHLHMHVFPRYRGDPFESSPIDPRMRGGAQEQARHLAIRKRLIEELAPPA